jgi:hypothetical protein
MQVRLNIIVSEADLGAKKGAAIDSPDDSGTSMV